ncbi:hypothetical protein JW859_11155 [bacterium]|nr:hypothetical protein [bacterium]
MSAIYGNHPVRCRELIAKARASLDFGALPEDQAAAVRLALDWYEFNLCRMETTEPEAVAKLFAEFRKRFSQTQAFARAELQRWRMYLLLRCEEDQDGFAALPREIVDEIISLHPDVEADPVIWQSLAMWAFKHNERDILERAYEVMLTHPSQTLGQAKWLRVNLLYRLVAGTATREDVEAVVYSQQVKPQLLEFIGQIWPRCQAAGLVDAELTALLNMKREEIDIDLPPVPKPERRTKTTRTPR